MSWNTTILNNHTLFPPKNKSRHTFWEVIFLTKASFSISTQNSQNVCLDLFFHQNNHKFIENYKWNIPMLYISHHNIDIGERVWKATKPLFLFGYPIFWLLKIVVFQDIHFETLTLQQKPIFLFGKLIFWHFKNCTISRHTFWKVNKV